MAVSAGTIWEPRATGNSVQNGSGFDPAYGGVDYSRQDAPQATYADLVASAMPVPSAAPTVSALVGGGSYSAATYYVVITWFNSDGNHETLISAQSSIAIASNGRLQITSPAAPGGADQYRVYVSTVSGSGYKLQATTNIGTNTILTSHNGSGATNPGSATLLNQLSSVARPFVANDKGNVLFNTGSSPWIGDRRYQIQNVVGGVATVDRSIVTTTSGATGGTARLGGGTSGGLAELTSPRGPAPGNKIWLKSGLQVTAGSTGWAYTSTNTQALPLTIEGYSVTRGDGLRAVINHNNNGTTIMGISGSFIHVKNLEMVGAGAATGLKGFDGTPNNCLFENCIFRDNKVPMYFAGSNCRLERCLFKNGGDACAVFPGGGSLQQNFLSYCRFTGGGTGGSGIGAGLDTGDGGLWVNSCIADNCIIGILHDFARFPTHITQTVIDNNSTAGLHIGGVGGTGSPSANLDGYGSIYFRQNIFSRNAVAVLNASGYNGGASYQSLHYTCNAFWDNTSNYSNVTAAPDDVELGSSPYTNLGTGNYALNSEADGGALVQLMACPGVFADDVNELNGWVGYGGIGTTPIGSDPPLIDFEEVQFPTDISRGTTGGPMFRNTIVVTGSGSEQRIVHWNDPIRKWDVGLGARTPAQGDELVSFFVARYGRAIGFRFKDWSDYLIPSPENALQINPTLFQIVKRYTSGTVTRVRRIKKPVEDTVQVWNGDTEITTGWTVDLTTGEIEFDSEPGYTPAVTCEFDVPVRFDTDEMRMTQNDAGSRSWDGIFVVEIRF